MSDTRNPESHAGSDDGQSNLDAVNYRSLALLVEELAQTMYANNLSRLALRSADLRISLDAAGSESDAGEFNAQLPVTEPDQHTSLSAAEPASGHVITAPMIGTFYIAPAPNEPPFVDVGDQVEEGQTIGIIEAMKIMNEIAADCAGAVIEIVARDGETVEYGSPLVIVAPFEA